MNKFIKIVVFVLIFGALSFGDFETTTVIAEDCAQAGVNDLSGSVDGADATLTVPEGFCPIEVSFSSYEHDGTLAPFEDQVLTDNITDTYGPGTHQIGTLDLACNWQADLYLGPVQEELIPDVGHEHLIDFDFVENQDCEEENLPPVVDAGDDRTITLPTNSVNLNATASDPDGEIVSYVWTQISGPTSGSIDLEDIEDPTASPLVEGVYVFKILVTDNDGAIADDQVTITVRPVSTNPYCADGVRLTPIEFHQAEDAGAIIYTPGSIAINAEETEASYHITNNTGCIMPVSISSYKMFESTPVLSTQELFDVDFSETTETSVTLVANLPTCSAQIDVWYGMAEETLIDENPYGDPARNPHVIDYKYSNFGDPFCEHPEDTATISAKKIVCDSEADLPNWGLGGADITSTTATTFLAEHPNCHQVDWTFEWAPDGTANPGDNTTAGGEGWTTFTSTAQVPTTLAGTMVWVREQFDTDYIPFVGDNSSNVSAEMYCHNDVLNYDNFDFINNMASGTTYHCIAFNVLEAVDHPQCSDDVDNADPEDTLIDEADPGCHTDGDATDGDETYNPNDNDETDETTGGGDDPECSDDVDNNDPEDTLIDEEDPGCHSDGDATDGDDTYNRNDDDETDVGDTECSDDIDNDGDEAIDEEDPGCHTDGDPNDGDDSYDPNDDSEQNDEDGGGGGGGGGGRRAPRGEVLGEESSCGIHVEKYLRIGYDNDVTSVVKVQSFLNMYMNAGLVTDGVYGPLTEAAVRNFQLARAQNVLAPWTIAESTGIFYLTTQTEVNNIMCPDLGLDIPSPLVNWSINDSVEKPAPNPGTTALYLDITGGAVLGDQYPK